MYVEFKIPCVIKMKAVTIAAVLVGFVLYFGNCQDSDKGKIEVQKRKNVIKLSNRN